MKEFEQVTTMSEEIFKKCYTHDEWAIQSFRSFYYTFIMYM